MIVLKDVDLLDPALRELLMEFRKVQVSRFPLEAMSNMSGRTLGFVDSRYPTDIFGYQHMAGVIHYFQDRLGEWRFSIESRLINNPKYGSYNTQKYTRESKDPKKILKYMRESIKPFYGHEIGAQTRKGVDEKFRVWRGEPDKKIREVIGYNLNTSELFDELLKLQALGVKPQTEKFRQLYEEGIPAWKEKLIREQKKLVTVHVLINPDDTIELSNNSHTFSKDSLDKCSEHVQQAVAMLRIMGKGDYVPEMGYKASDRAFWVEVPSSQELWDL